MQEPPPNGFPSFDQLAESMLEPKKAALPSFEQLTDFVAPVEESEVFPVEDTAQPDLAARQQSYRASLSLADMWNPWAQANKQADR